MKIILSESQFITVFKKTLKENTSKKFEDFGCKLFPQGSHEREWCELAVSKINSSKVREVSNAINEYKNLIKTSNWTDFMSNLKFFSSEDEFFKTRLEQLEEVKKILSKNCKNIGENLDNEFTKKFSKESIFVYLKDEKQEYSLLNKLNSNYSALAFLLTKFKQNTNMTNATFEEVFNSYFKLSESDSNRGLESQFFRFLTKYFEKEENATKLMDDVLKTIRITTEIGKGSELEAEEYLTSKFKKSENIVSFAGDYSFVDMMGIDFLLNTKVGWVPMQVKSKIEYCRGNDLTCLNYCMGKTQDNRWQFIKYNGAKKIDDFFI